jgi:hypothetical protein
VYYLHRFLNKREDTSYFSLGRAIHDKLMFPQFFDDLYFSKEITVPNSKNKIEFITEYLETKDVLKSYKNNYKKGGNDEKILEEANKILFEYQNYIDYMINHKDKAILNQEQVSKINAISENVDILSSRNSTFNTLISNDNNIVKECFNEQSIYFEYNGIRFKSRVDKIVIDYTNKKIYIVDIKTSSSYVSNFDNSFSRYNYLLQAAMYNIAVRSIVDIKSLINKGFDIENYIVAIETNEPHNIAVIKLDESIVSSGIDEFNKIIEDNYNFLIKEQFNISDIKDNIGLFFTFKLNTDGDIEKETTDKERHSSEGEQITHAVKTVDRVQ